MWTCTAMWRCLRQFLLQKRRCLIVLFLIPSLQPNHLDGLGDLESLDMTRNEILRDLALGKIPE